MKLIWFLSQPKTYHPYEVWLVDLTLLNFKSFIKWGRNMFHRRLLCNDLNSNINDEEISHLVCTN
jgi:hypothetical protein